MENQKFICNCIFQFKAGEWADDWEPGDKNPCQRRIRAMVMAALEGSRYFHSKDEKARVELNLSTAADDRLVVVKTFTDGTCSAQWSLCNKIEKSEDENTVVCKTIGEFMLLSSVRVDTDKYQYFTNGFDWWYFNGRNPYMVESAKRLGYRRPTLKELKEIARNGATLSDLKSRYLNNPHRRTGEEDYEIARCIQLLFEQAGNWVEAEVSGGFPKTFVDKVSKRIENEHGMKIEKEVKDDSFRIRIKPEDINFID